MEGILWIAVTIAFFAFSIAYVRSAIVVPQFARYGTIGGMAESGLHRLR